MFSKLGRVLVCILLISIIVGTAAVACGYNTIAAVSLIIFLTDFLIFGFQEEKLKTPCYDRLYPKNPVLGLSILTEAKLQKFYETIEELTTNRRLEDVEVTDGVEVSIPVLLGG